MQVFHVHMESLFIGNNHYNSEEEATCILEDDTHESHT